MLCVERERVALTCVCATGGLVGASLGAIAVFGVGVVGVLGAAKAVGSLLGVCASGRSTSAAEAKSNPSPPTGHSLDAKRESAPPAAPTAKPTGA